MRDIPQVWFRSIVSQALLFVDTLEPLLVALGQITQGTFQIIFEKRLYYPYTGSKINLILIEFIKNIGRTACVTHTLYLLWDEEPT